MITFPRINFATFQNFAGIKSAKTGVYESSNQNQNIYIYDKNTKFAGNNLAPLNADTVSFSGRRKVEKQDVAHLYETAWSTGDGEALKELENIVNHTEAGKKMTPVSYSLYRDMLPVAKELHKQAKDLETAFDAKMWIFDGLLLEDKRKSPPIPPRVVSKETRIKSQQSIAKKLAAKIVCDSEYDHSYRPLMDVKIAKDTVHDTFGARLILKNGTMGETNGVINRIINSYRDGDAYNINNGLKIKAIKNYGRSDKNRYTSLKKIVELCDTIEAAGGKRPAVMNDIKRSGYTATHIIFEVGNGIDGEIQILGRGVFRVKNVEDVCYKGLQGKALEGMTEISKELKKIGKDPVLTKEFKEYLCSAYDLAKSKWDKMPDDMLEAQRFPKIPDKFPSCLDLNNIEKAIVDARENPKTRKKTGGKK